MPSSDLSSFEARYSFLSRLRGPYFGYFLFRYFLLGSVYSRVFSLACLIFLLFPQQLNPLQDLQKATNWGDMCGSRRERMALVLCCHIAWHILLV